MFERKNQNILSEHYTKLIDHEPIGGGSLSDSEDFITLKRADHGLDEHVINPDVDLVDAQTFSANLSKRKLKLGKAKRALLTTGVPKKLVFDDEGHGREVYAVADGEEWIRERGGEGGVMEEGRRYAEGERGRMKEGELQDKEEAREKKREKKRKRKEREKESMGFGSVGNSYHGGILLYSLWTQAGSVSGPILAPPSDDDGYVSPEFDVPSEDEDEVAMHATKRSKFSHRGNDLKLNLHSRNVDVRTVEEDEELALALLRRR